MNHPDDYRLGEALAICDQVNYMLNSDRKKGYDEVSSWGLSLSRVTYNNGWLKDSDVLIWMEWCRRK